jgi:hypothetical protein
MGIKLAEPCPVCSSQYWCERPCAAAPKGVVAKPVTVKAQVVAKPIVTRDDVTKPQRVLLERIAHLEDEIRQLKRALAEARGHQGGRPRVGDEVMSPAERMRLMRKRKAEKRNG